MEPEVLLVPHDERFLLGILLSVYPQFLSLFFFAVKPFCKPLLLLGLERQEVLLERILQELSDLDVVLGGDLFVAMVPANRVLRLELLG